MLGLYTIRERSIQRMFPTTLKITPRTRLQRRHAHRKRDQKHNL